MFGMQRIAWVLFGLVPAAAVGQESAGTELWRLAAATVQVPQALVTGGAAAFWNPAQAGGPARALFALEIVQTPAVVGASGFLTSLRLRVQPLGYVGVVFGRMELGDLVPTSVSPEPDAGGIPFYAQSVGATWSGVRGGGSTAVGVTVALHDTRLDLARSRRWTLDVGLGRRVTETLRLAAATHFFSRFSSDDPAQDVYGGVEYRVWEGPLWDEGSLATVLARYGVVLAHGVGADHQFGGGLSLDGRFTADLLVVREEGFAGAAWRAVAGIGLVIGRYRVTFARDAGINDIGAAYRVGLEARLQ